MQIKVAALLAISTLSIYATEPERPTQGSGRAFSLRENVDSILEGDAMKLSPIAEDTPERIITHAIKSTQPFMNDLGYFEVVIPAGNSVYQGKYVLEYLKYFKEFIAPSLDDFSIIKGIPLSEIKSNTQNLLNLEASLIERRLAKFKEGSVVDLPCLLRFTFH